MPLTVWHTAPDTPRHPVRPSAHEAVHIHVGTYPIEPGQKVRVTWSTGKHPHAAQETCDAEWERNEGSNSYWSATLGPFPEGMTVAYQVHAEDDFETVSTDRYEFRVGPKIYLALMWHMHQPDYRTARSKEGAPVLSLPWVRLHSLRDYYSMPALLLEHHDVHITFNLTPVLLAQIQAYTDESAMDRHLELTLTPVEELDDARVEKMLDTFFDADWHRQVFVHRRYRELLEKRVRGESFEPSDLRDLQMWSNLAWFGKEFRDGPVTLATGEIVNVRGWVQKERDFTSEQVGEMVEEQFKILRAILPIYRRLQQRGQVEISTSPYAHPILPLLMDTDAATLDLPGATLPIRFARPEDAEAQLDLARKAYQSDFGCPLRGMWPPEGAVSRSTVPLYAQAGATWIASDRQVLARSGKFGYEVNDPDVMCQPYSVREEGEEVAIFFRDTHLSDAIGFRYQHVDDAGAAAAAFLHEIEDRFAHRFSHDEDRVVTVILDGENAWGAYADDGRPFLHAMYRRLAKSLSVRTVTFAEYLAGNPARMIDAHPPQEEVHQLFAASWIDETRSAPGVDLGTWIGEPSENYAWELLGEARSVVDGAPSEVRSRALTSIFAAEGSDWFWWLGDDQDSGRDEVFDEIFRAHLRSAYTAVGLAAPERLAAPLSPRRVIWSVTQPAQFVMPGDELVVRTNCPGSVIWREDEGPEKCANLHPFGGVLAGNRRFQARLGRVSSAANCIDFRLECSEPSCSERDRCCSRAKGHLPVRARLT